MRLAEILKMGLRDGPEPLDTIVHDISFLYGQNISLVERQTKKLVAKGEFRTYSVDGVTYIAQS